MKRIANPVMGCELATSFGEVDRLYADLTTEYGARKEADSWVVSLWNPLAKKVDLLIYDKDDRGRLLFTITGSFSSPNWHWRIDKDIEGCYYEFFITHADLTNTLALDPYAKTIGAFNWNDPLLSRPLGRFVDLKTVKLWRATDWIPRQKAIIYESSVRDLTSTLSELAEPGTYTAAIQADIGSYLSMLNFTHVQLMPVHSCAAIDETDRHLLGKGEGSGWSTNYNWGYDPLNYFSVNGWLSTDPHDPYTRSKELQALVEHFHSNGVGVILDVVYNHLFDNKVLDAVFPGYYFRTKGKNVPVKHPPLASERKMVRRLIVDSLVHFVNYYGVDGFRFDLMGFTDRRTMELIARTLKKIKKGIVLHGEAWDFTDLPAEQALVKGKSDNRVGIAYFNDTSRDAIKGKDEQGFNGGLVTGNLHYFSDYLTAITGSLRGELIDRLATGILPAGYERFTIDAKNVLNYAACHDGHTLWDKINLTVRGSRSRKIDAYRQALLMQAFLPGHLLYLQGTELFYTKPADKSGYEWEKSHSAKGITDLYGLNNRIFAFNTFKTTDYSNGIRWKEAQSLLEVSQTRQLVAALNEFRRKHGFFQIRKEEEFFKNFRFNKHADGIIDFEIQSGSKKIRVIHNFTSKDYGYPEHGKIVFCSRLLLPKKGGFCPSHCSMLLSVGKDNS